MIRKLVLMGIKMALLPSLLKLISPVDNDVILNNVSSKNSPRENFISAVRKQIELVKSDVDNKPGSVTGKKWYKVVDKNAYTFVRYSVKKIKILPTQTDDNAALRVGTNYASLIKFYDNLIKVAEAGELDDVLNKVAADMIEERKTSRDRNAKDPEYQEKRKAAKAKRKVDSDKPEPDLLNNEGE